jgi:hypothetical protein
MWQAVLNLIFPIDFLPGRAGTDILRILIADPVMTSELFTALDKEDFIIYNTNNFTKLVTVI